MRKLLVFLLTLVTLITVTACGGPEKKAAAPAQPTRVTLGMLRLTSSAPLFIAMDKGYFKEENLEVKPEWFDAAQPIAVATASSNIDVGATGITASLYNMAAEGQSLAIVADKGREQKGHPSSALLVSNEAYGKGVHKVEDLKGKRIGITQKGSSFHYMIGRILEAKGINPDEVTLVPLGKLSAVMAALQTGKIDACILNEPNVTKVENAGYGKSILPVSDVLPYQVSALFYSPNFIKDKDTATRFMRAYVKACNYYYDYALEGKDEKKKDEIIKIIARYVKAPEEDIRLGLPYIDRDGHPMKDDIGTQIDWYAGHQLLTKKPALDAVVDTSFLDKALESGKK